MDGRALIPAAATAAGTGPGRSRAPSRRAGAGVGRTEDPGQVCQNRAPNENGGAAATVNGIDYDFDLFVIGAGSGGTRAARIAAGYGARVAVAEERFLGGTCVNVGCIPKKLFVYASHYAEDFEDAAGYGWRGPPDEESAAGAPAFDWPTLVANKDREIERLNGIYRGLIEGAGARLYDTRATIAGPHAISVAGSTVTARHILVATGGEPTLPELPGIEHAIRSDDVFYLDRLPERLIVVGGGYIAVELAGVFAGLGVEVTQLYRGPLFLRGFDDDIRHALAGEMRKRGVALRFDANVAAIERMAAGGSAGTDGVQARLAAVGGGAAAAGGTAGDGEILEADLILYATGRHPLTSGLGLENAGVATAPNGAIRVDAWSRTNVEHIFAVGDVTDRINLTPVAIREGHCFAETVFNDNPIAPDHEVVPTAVFSQPAIGTCGLTETQAAARYPAIDVYLSSFRPLKHTLSGRDQRSVMKLVVDAATDRVIGCHLLDPDAAEIMQGVGIAVKCGATKAQFDRTMAIHPTAAEEIVTMRAPVRRLRRGEEVADVA